MDENEKKLQELQEYRDAMIKEGYFKTAEALIMFKLECRKVETLMEISKSLTSIENCLWREYSEKKVH
jgi:hypothetical protein